MIQRSGLKRGHQTFDQDYNSEIRDKYVRCAMRLLKSTNSMDEHIHVVAASLHELTDAGVVGAYVVSRTHPFPSTGAPEAPVVPLLDLATPFPPTRVHHQHFRLKLELPPLYHLARDVLQHHHLSII